MNANSPKMEVQTVWSSVDSPKVNQASSMCELSEPILGYSTEEWKEIENPSGRYLISSWGRVARLLEPFSGAAGHKFVALWTGRKFRERFTRSVHSLVMEAFVGPRPKDMLIHHLNHDPTINRMFNLRYVTPRENMQFSIDAGRFVPKHNPRKLTSEQALEIRKLYRAGISPSKLAKQFALSEQAMRATYLNGVVRRWGRKISHEERNAIIAVLRERKHRNDEPTPAQLAEKYGLATGYVRALMRKHGISVYGQKMEQLGAWAISQAKKRERLVQIK